MADLLDRVAAMAAVSADREAARATRIEAERAANQRDFAALVAFRDAHAGPFPGVKIGHAYNEARSVGAPFPGIAVKPILESDLYPDGHPYAEKREAVSSEGKGSGMRAVSPAGARRNAGKPASPAYRGRGRAQVR